MRDHTESHTESHTDGSETPGNDTHGGRERSGAVLSIVPAAPRVGQQFDRRRAAGPRPVRPAAGSGRPAQRPACRTLPRHPEQEWVGRPQEAQRVLVRGPRSVAEPLAWRFRVRRAVAGAVAVLAAAAVVVGLGLLADTASAARHPAPAAASAAGSPAEVTVTVGAGETLAQIVRRAVPGVDGAELDAVVERTVTANSLTSVSVRPGQVLRVPVR